MLRERERDEKEISEKREKRKEEIIKRERGRK